MQQIDLTDGGLLFYDDAFVPAEQSEHYFLSLRGECKWEQKPGLFGYPQPRLIASYGDAGVAYKYSGVVNVALPWTKTLREIKNRIETVYGQYNYCLLNRYRSGADSMGWHADDEPEMGDVVASVSLGAIRRFRLRHNESGETLHFDLPSGSLLIMAGTTQQFWQHAVPKSKRAVGERINLTFRMIRSH